MKSPVNINIEDYDYLLPPERVAQFPAEKRDHSKLLINKNGNISHDYFYNIKKHLSEKSLLVFNDTRVIHARLLFKKSSGTSPIEIFCLEPDGKDLQIAFQQKGNCEWKCFVGNNKKWKSGRLKIENNDLTLFAERIKHNGENFVVRFSWEPQQLIFSEVLEIAGKVPLPPYICREALSNDHDRYQTIYAANDGSVAAPTAGLHFTRNILNSLADYGIKKQYLTLHVGAGTFKPVSSKYIADHEMHREHFIVSRQFLENILAQLKENNPIIPVGTTSLRTLETLYRLGVKKIKTEEAPVFLDQWEMYQADDSVIPAEDSVVALLSFMNENRKEYLSGSTRMIIVPGYDFKIAGGLITNFHQPRSTLLLLVAAMVGCGWKESYNYALGNDFRFLSYGDCCLFMK